MSQGRIPSRFFGTCVLPHEAVQRIFLAFPPRIPPAFSEDGHHVVFVQARDGSEAFVVPHPEVEIVVNGVNVPRLLQLHHFASDGWDRLHSADVVIGGQYVETGHVVTKQICLTVGDLSPVLTGGDGSLEQGVIDVCDVLDVAHLMPCVSPDSIDHVESNIGIRMPDMCCVIRGNSAHVHRRVSRGRSRANDTCRGFEKSEWFSLSAQSARHRCRP